MNFPTLSVIMPNYNHAQYLPQSLGAILEQSFRPMEVIVLDDASTDNSVEIIEHFAKQDPIIRLVRNDRNLGCMSTQKKGLELASGDYFLLPSADDLMLPGFLEKTMNLLARYPQAGLGCSIGQRIDEKGNHLPSMPEPPYISKSPCFLDKEQILKLWLYGESDWCISSSVIWRHQSYMECGGFPLDSGDFPDGFMVPLISINYGACFIPEELSVYRVLPDSLGSIYRRDHKKLEERVTKMMGLMTGKYSHYFPSSFVREFKRRSIYEMGSMVLENLNVSVKDCENHLNNSIQTPHIIDQIFFTGVRFSSMLQKFILKFYLFLKFRNLSWIMFYRLFYRLRNNQK